MKILHRLSYLKLVAEMKYLVVLALSFLAVRSAIAQDEITDPKVFQLELPVILEKYKDNSRKLAEETAALKQRLLSLAEVESPDVYERIKRADYLYEKYGSPGSIIQVTGGNVEPYTVDAEGWQWELDRVSSNERNVRINLVPERYANAEGVKYGFFVVGKSESSEGQSRLARGDVPDDVTCLPLALSQRSAIGFEGAIQIADGEIDRYAILAIADVEQNWKVVSIIPIQ